MSSTEPLYIPTLYNYYMNETKRLDLIADCEDQVEALIHELENTINENILLVETYHGDIIKDGRETEGTKIMFSTSMDDPSEFGETASEMTVQDIIIEYHDIEKKLKKLMSASVGLDFITDKYLEIIEMEKKEARKALGVENEDYFKLL